MGPSTKFLSLILFGAASMLRKRFKSSLTMQWIAIKYIINIFMIYWIAIHCIAKEDLNTFLRYLVWIKLCCIKNCRNVVKYFSLATITSELLPALVLKFFQTLSEKVQKNKLWQLCFRKTFSREKFYEIRSRVKVTILEFWFC